MQATLAENKQTAVTELRLSNQVSLGEAREGRSREREEEVDGE